MWYFYAIIKTLFTEEWHPLSVRTAGQREVRSAVTGTFNHLINFIINKIHLWVCSSSLRKQTRQKKDNSNSDNHSLEPKYVEEHLWKRRRAWRLKNSNFYLFIISWWYMSFQALQCGRCWFFSVQQHTQFSKLDIKWLEKTLAGLMSLDFFCDICKAGSDPGLAKWT